MPKVMPVAIRDETGAFIRQMAQGNEALAQLYTRLLAQYEERRMNEAHQKEMMGMRESITQDRIGAQNEEWYRRQEFAHNLRNPQQQQGPNYLGPGAAGTPNPMAPGAAQPTAAPTSATPAARPSVYTIDNNPFSKGAGTGTPAAPAPQKTSMSGEAADAYAQAPQGAGHQDFSAQSRTKPLPTVEQPPRTPRKEPADNTQLPTQPRVTARTAATRPQAHFLPIDQKWLDLMHQKEDEFKLPRGTLMTAYGLENGGGRQFGKNPRSSAEGIFQFTRELRDEYKLSDQDIYNPEKMIHAAAFNMRRNADILEQNYKVKLPLTPEAVPMFVGLHQWGSGAGPRIVAAYLQNPEAPMTKVMGTHKDRNGNVIPNYNVLANNGQNPSATVQDALKNKSAPHLNAYIQQFPDHANSPPGKYTSIPVPQPEPGAERQQAATSQPQVGDPNAPRPPSNIPPQQHGTMGSHPRLVAAVRGGASVALPEGYTIRQTSGHRPGDSGYHGRGHAGDFQIYTPDGKPIPNRGEDTTGLYTKLARGVKTWVRENDPQLERAIGYGGAHGTQKGGGGVPDLMHYDLGGSRGRMRPEVQFARLQPLGADERNAPIQAAQKPQPQQQAQAPQAPPVAPERAIMPAISRIPTSGEVAATYDNKIANAGFDGQRTPRVAATPAAAPVIAPEPAGVPIKPGASGLAARSDLDYNAPPDISAQHPAPSNALASIDMPMPPERPSEGGNLGDASTPADAQIPGDQYGSYASLPMPPMRAPDTEFTQADRTAKPGAPDESVQDAMAEAFKQRTDPTYTQEAFNVQKPPADMPPQLEAGVIPKQPLPNEFTPATPGTPEQQLAIDVPSITPRAALPPGFKVPLPALDGGMTAAASAPSGQMPRGGTQLPPNLPRQLEPEVVSGNAPTMRSVLDAIYKGQLPDMGTNDPNAPPRPPSEPATGEPYNEYVQSRDSKASLEQIGEWLKQNFGPQGQPENQKIFNAAMQDYVRRAVSGAHDWWNKPSAQPPKMHPDARMPQSVAPPPQPIRTMPDGRPYIPQGEPLNVPPRPGAGPTNTTLSGGPQQGAAPLPALPGKVNPMTGRVDIPQPVKQPDGTILYTEPGEVPQEVE